MLRIDPDSIAQGRSTVDHASEFGIVWVHAVSTTSSDPEPYSEAKLLLASAAAAHSEAVRHQVPVVFVAILPMPGIYVGPEGLVYDLALSTMTSLMRTQIRQWTSGGCRIVGLVHAGFGIDDGTPGKRDSGTIRDRSPMKDSVSIDDLVDALAYVGSPATSYLSGVLLHIDGGSQAYSWVHPARDH
ncbi:hypothetical protein [Aeromicrobium sp.]|uniref:hypothetical protein n=1 Tax=Aeromicrobium sp. TaxID=1871063 RepID=UPI002FCC2E2E